MRVGIFDSGLGGFTILNSLLNTLKGCHFIYLGDTARLPYGTKSKSTIEKYAQQSVNFLLSKHVDIIVVACNTVSALALETLKKDNVIPIYGVVEAGVEAALALEKKDRILVLGTPATVKSESYLRSFDQRSPHSKITQIACPLLVPLAEEGWWDHPITEQIISSYLSGVDLQSTDSIVLGCTHYPLLIDSFKKIVGSLQMVHGGDWLSEQLKAQIRNSNLSNKLDVFLTDATSASMFGKLLPNMEYQKIDL